MHDEPMHPAVLRCADVYAFELVLRRVQQLQTLLNHCDGQSFVAENLSTA
jgi:hypothetical protein